MIGLVLMPGAAATMLPIVVGFCIVTAVIILAIIIWS